MTRRSSPSRRCILNPASISRSGRWGGAAFAFAWLALRSLRRRGRLRARALLRALLSRRQLRSRSTRADALYALASLAMLGAIIGWAVISTNWVSEGVVALLARPFGPPADPAPDIWRDAARTLALFLAYDIGFFVDHTLKHRIPALWELHKVHHAAETLTPLVNFRVHPLDALMLANMLALFIGVGGGVATYLLGPRATSFLLFDDNVLMILYIFLTAQLQHSEIWIPFTGLWGRFLMSPAHHQLHHSSGPGAFQLQSRREPGAVGLARGLAAHAFDRVAAAEFRRLRLCERSAWRRRLSDRADHAFRRFALARVAAPRSGSEPMDCAASGTSPETRRLPSLLRRSVSGSMSPPVSSGRRPIIGTIAASRISGAAANCGWRLPAARRRDGRPRRRRIGSQNRAACRKARSRRCL